MATRAALGLLTLAIAFHVRSPTLAAVLGAAGGALTISTFIRTKEAR